MVSAAASGASPKPFSRSAETGRSVAITMARACASASSRVTLPSRRPSTPAQATLEVASAWEPRPARMRADPAYHGLGITNAPGPLCNARKRAALSSWLMVISEIPTLSNDAHDQLASGVAPEHAGRLRDGDPLAVVPAQPVDDALGKGAHFARRVVSHNDLLGTGAPALQSRRIGLRSLAAQQFVNGSLGVG